MMPVMRSRYLAEENSESSEHEESVPAPGTLSDDLNSSLDSTLTIDSNSSVHSTLSIEPTSEDDLAACTVEVIDLTSPMPSTSGMPPTFPIQMPLDYPIASFPSTLRGIQENYDDFRFEAARRSSFQNCPVSFIDPASFAAAGLYYTGEADIVRCFECQLEIRHWSEGHTPMTIHEMHSPDCKFVRREHCNNVPIGQDPDKYLRRKRRNRNISCPYGLQYKDSFDFNDHRFLRYARNPSAYELSRLGLTSVKEPKNLDYSTYKSRLNSFANWPTYMKQTGEALADAGFYYTGVRDITTCYHCGVGIGNWKTEEEPWVQHAMLSPCCSYLLTVRGTQYVNDATGQELYDTCEGPSVQTTAESHEKATSDNEVIEMTLPKKQAALEEEKKKLIDARRCTVCKEREAIMTFIPCGHLVTCQYCSQAFGQCLICGREIEAQIRVFF
ncbi:baculoviral IAP repeat-containing protein 3-like [Bombus pascuorum]|uniref:baculoviral IAP repeat-containing protein 3-like n=1 Tax=Bombus pascuorum TaxID=65598 RepID=UPI00298EC61A|nr:baculoviral IAP repeat-containing protein 3-like [Bombus pascuorum]XP_060822313.1 baculoviral IAP repeat-containing protein 3-like [Bombus pascuorum]XP_060822314.1 baculoviral IAP repeat-containing protein 3-like [Bombus pascuorum]XP_060822316.1 baculoviral IAP repeat-containing protein 3-like [Bombus pascuorum]